MADIDDIHTLGHIGVDASEPPKERGPLSRPVPTPDDYKLEELDKLKAYFPSLVDVPAFFMAMVWRRFSQQVYDSQFMVFDKPVAEAFERWAGE